MIVNNAQQLPSLPQILLRVLNAVHSNTADYQKMADVIRTDTAMAAKLIGVANSSYYGRSNSCDSVERALLMLGTDTVKTLVITAATKHFFNQFNQQHRDFLQQFWRRSLLCAHMAQVLATLTRYQNPDEAYLCGLLSDVGQLVLLTHHEKDYLRILSQANGDLQLLEQETQQFQCHHASLGGELLAQWNLQNFMADAVRYHHEPAAHITDTHHLVKLINLASALSIGSWVEDQALARAQQLFGLNEDLVRELRGRIDRDVIRLAGGMGIDIDDNASNAERAQLAQQQLGQSLIELGEIARLRNQLQASESLSNLQATLRRSLSLTFAAENCLLFLLDSDSQQLCASIASGADTHNDFAISCSKGRSIVSDALLARAAQSSDGIDTAQLRLVDQQLLRYCGQALLVAWPLCDGAEPIGTLLFGCSQQRWHGLQHQPELLQALCAAITQAIKALRTTDSAAPASEDAEQTDLRIREAVHEASNPLSIINNYLGTLRIKLGEEHEATASLQLIKEEIDRVGAILLSLKNPSTPSQPDALTDINLLISNTAEIFRDSIFSTRALQLDLDVDQKLKPIKINTGALKQVLTNLIKNGAEALPAGGRLAIRTEANISVNGQSTIAITVVDNGPGLPENVQQNLFSPVESSKGGEHSGLGLSIVKKLVDEMNGSIMCRSRTGQGTEFQILLPTC